MEEYSRLIGRSLEIKPKKHTLTILFSLWLLLVSVISYFHEPWYDEAQSWQIARCTSVRDIIFDIPHYEGHPPLWHLLLVPFAKTGMPYELSLSLVNILFMGAAVWVLMFKTKLPFILKASLPFTYFMFYQYGVISRPYSIMALAFMLCAVFYDCRNEKPLSMVLSLMLLCASSAYGLAFAFFICVIWLIELMRGKKFTDFLKEFIKSRTFICLVILAVFAVLLLLMMLPADNCLVSAAKEYQDTKYHLNNFAYTMLLLPFDATVGQILTKDCNIAEENFLKAGMIPFALLSTGVYAVIFIMARDKGKTLLAVPLILISAVFGAIFFFSHHIGIFTLYIYFLVCLCVKEDDSPSDEVSLKRRNIYMTFIYAMTAMQIFWSISSAGLEVSKSYSCGREMAMYIKESGISDSYILNSGSINGYTDSSRKVRNYDFGNSAYPVITLPYLDRNIYPAYNITEGNKGFFLNYAFTSEELADQLEKIKALGTPDYIVGMLREEGDISEKEGEKARLPEGYFDFVFSEGYALPEADFENGMIFKGHYIGEYDVINKVYRKNSE